MEMVTVGSDSVPDSLTANKTPAEEQPLRVGVLRRTKNALPMISALNLMAYMAKNFNIELWFFTSKDVDMENKTVNATLIEGGSRTEKIIPLPKIIYNHFECLRDETRKEMKDFLYKECFFVNSGVWWLGKQEVYNKLLADGRFKEFLIESHPVKSFDDLLLLLEQYGNDVVVKPEGGMQGNGVLRITLKGTEYVINRKEGIFSLKNIDALRDYYNEKLTQSKQMLQPYIVSRTKYDVPFDIRIHARRGAEGKFQLFPYPRIGKNSEALLSNISAGGHTMPMQRFLRQEFGNDSAKVYKQLMDLGSSFPDYFQSFFKRRISAMGIDVGIQRRGNSWELKIFEIQSDSPGYSAIETEVAFTNLDYLSYLGKLLSKEKNAP